MVQNVDRLRGSVCPVVTPFNERDEVDEGKLRELIDWQLDNGTHGISVTGTTGEPSSLTLEERERVMAIAVEHVAGRRERRRLAGITTEHAQQAQGVTTVGGSRVISGVSDSVSSGAGGDGSAGEEGEEAGEDLRRPRLFWFNVALTIAVIACLVAAVAPPELLFLVAVLIALLVNYPGLKQQTARIEAHSKGAMLMATTLLAAGVFLGILEGSGMIDAMASTAAD